MRIILKNFKCWLDKELIIPDEGIILLSARSGKGKSSILDAIFFCLFGEGQKIVSHTKSGCSVEIHIDDFIIKRTRRPNHLSLISDEGQFEDDVAQSIINDHFGSLFDTISYVKQNGMNTFLRMTPTEKLEFIERAIFQGTNLGQIKQKSREYIKECNDKLVATVSRLQTYREMLAGIPVPEKVDFPVKVRKEDYPKVERNEGVKKKNAEISIRRCNESINTLKSLSIHLQMIIDNQKNKDDKICEMKQKIKDFEEDKRELEKDWIGKTRLSELYDILDRLEKNRIYLELKERIESEEKDLNDIISSESRIKESKLNDLQMRIESLGSKSDLQYNLEENKEYLKDLEKYSKLKEESLDFRMDESQLQNLQIDLEKNQKLIDGYHIEISSLERSRDIYPCPHCEKSIVITEEGLIPSEDLIIEDVEEKICQLEKEVKEKSKEVKRLKTEISKATEILGNVKRIDKEIDEIKGVYEGIDEIDIDHEIGEIRNCISECIKSIQEIDILTRNLKDVQKDEESSSVKMIQKRLDGFRKDLSLIKFDEKIIRYKKEEIKKEYSTGKELGEKINNLEKEIKDYLNRVTELENEINLENQKFMEKYELSDIPTIIEITEKIEEKQEELKENNTKLNKANETLEAIQKFQKYQSEKEGYDNLLRKIGDSESEEKEHRSLLAGASMLKDKISEAESLSISNFIETLSLHVNLHLENFFKEEPMIIEIESFKAARNAKEPAKPQINIKIDYKGNEVDLSNLSGGERDRLDLAFTLSLCEIFGSRILLLDECISSLDYDTAGNVLDGLKENYKGKSILIVLHQANEGVFDSVIKF